MQPKDKIKGINPLTLFPSGEAEYLLVHLEGSISPEMLANAAKKLQQRAIGCHRKLASIIFSLTIELGQNILIHSSERESNLGKGLLIAKESKDYFHLISMNLADAQVADKVKAKCDLLNSFNEAGKADFYRQQLALPRKKDQKGGSIGLVLMARKTCKPIQCLVEEAFNGKSWLKIGLTINKKA